MSGIDIQIPESPRKWSRPYAVVKNIGGRPYEFELCISEPIRMSNLKGQVMFREVHVAADTVNAGREFLLEEWRKKKTKRSAR